MGVVVAAGASIVVIAQGASQVQLGSADSFAVLAGSTVTNTGPSVINGNVGLSPGSSVTGFPPGIVSAGAVHVADGLASQAQNDLGIAYNDAAGRSSSATVSADLAGTTLTAGVYTAPSSMGLSGDLTLDGQGDPNAVFVFQAGSTLTVASGSRVLLIGGASACNVWWQVGSSAMIGTDSAFAGNILALTSISLTTGATLNGRALARNGAVTLDTNVITKPTCTTGSTTGGTTGSTTGSTTGTTTGGTTAGGTTGATTGGTTGATTGSTTGTTTTGGTTGATTGGTTGATTGGTTGATPATTTGGTTGATSGGTTGTTGEPTGTTSTPGTTGTTTEATPVTTESKTTTKHHPARHPTSRKHRGFTG